MTQDDFDQFCDMWSAAWELIGKKVTPGQLNLAFELLRRYELADITQALTAHMNDPDAGQFAPKPADIVKHISGSKGTRSARAWSKVDRAIRQVGSYQSIVFDDPTIHAVIDDMGGWTRICRTLEKELPFVAREFENRYQGYALKGIPDSWPRKLIGECEAYNLRNGYEVAPPVLIGNEERAIRVLEQGGDAGRLKITRASDLLQNAVKALQNKQAKD